MKKRIIAMLLIAIVGCMSACQNKPKEPVQTEQEQQEQQPMEEPEHAAIDFAEHQLYAVAYLGYQEATNLEAYVEAYLNGEKPDRIFVSGGDVYLIIPRYPDMKMKLMKNNIETEQTELIYETERCKPFVLDCNISDIVPDVTIQLTYGEEVIEFTPFISLKDGSIMIEEHGLLLPEQ